MKGIGKILATGCVIFTIAGCNHQSGPLSQEEKHTVTELTGNLKTRCVGRYLIDLPEDATESGYATIGGVNIETKAMTEDAYRQEVSQREAQLKGTKSIDAYPFLYSAESVFAKEARYFIHRGSVYSDPATRQIEAYMWEHGYRISLKVETFDYTHPDQTNDVLVQKMTVKNRLREKVGVVLTLLGRLRGRPKEEIPSEPGVCFAGGFFPSAASSDQYVDSGFRMANNRDVSFDVSVDTEPQGNTTLLQRIESPEVRAMFKAADSSDIRKGIVDLSGLKAEEWLSETRRPGGGRGNLFTLTVNETTSGPTSPYLSLDMYTGGQLLIQGKFVKLDRGSLSTGEAVALWDAVSRTVRMRPGAL
ncbi:T6SS immunity protein Tli4 family protein [Paraburkholderia sp. BR10937]|uniref:T6SS immunity protein Tli4 family protein n=1 Tax=Paraburkholderia sp. BR10937 TaxID=3236994 RepID=UPI0034D1F91D